MAKFNFVSIIVYVWIISLIVIVSKFFIQLFNAIIDYTIIFKPLKDFSFGMKSPIMFIPCMIYQIITVASLMTFWGILFGAISTFILILLIIWQIIVAIWWLKFIAGWTPFKELTPIFKAIIGKTSFGKALQTYTSELAKIIEKKFEVNYQGVMRENFENYKKPNKTIEKFANKKGKNEEDDDINNSKYLDNYYYTDLEEKYKSYDNYYIGAYKNYQHSKDAEIYKNYKIITPDMKDKELSTALFDNNTLQTQVNATSLLEKLYRI
jgi:hypothetical protein